LIGGAGNDVYVVAVAGDSLVEAAGGGTDTVETALSVYLLRAAEVENLTGTSAAGQTLVGSSRANTIVGAGGADLIDGGLGADLLIGNSGADSYLFDSALGGDNIDTIMGFVTADDRILLDHTVFAGMGLGKLDPGAFVIGSEAVGDSDRIIYDPTTGALYYDADGGGGGAAVQFAILLGHPPLAATDFLVI
jgi:Ca2+-binding RTX toxin-like protein